MNNPLVSVIIPVYNAEKYLGRCLSTINDQLYRPLEIILVDDGSRDSSGKICDDYANSHPDGISVKVIHQQNAGASIARKRGIEAANGEWISFIDADDFVSAEYVSSLYAAALKFNGEVAVCDYATGSFNSTTLNKQPSNPTPFQFYQEEIIQHFFKYKYWGFWGAIYRKYVFDVIDFPTETINEDYYVKAQIFTRLSTVPAITTPLYFYEKHQGSLSSLNLSERSLGEFDNAMATWQYIKRHKPQYTQHALAIVSESACKLLGQLKDANFTDNPTFRTRKIIMRKFIISNFMSIMLNRHLLWKIKLVLLKNLI